MFRDLRPCCLREAYPRFGGMYVGELPPDTSEPQSSSHRCDNFKCSSLNTVQFSQDNLNLQTEVLGSVFLSKYYTPIRRLCYAICFFHHGDDDGDYDLPPGRWL
jgi:hypothetical protein